MNLNKKMTLALVAAIAATSLQPQMVRAEDVTEAQVQASGMTPELAEFLGKDIVRIRGEIALQQKSIVEFQKVLKSAKIKRTLSIVVNSVQVAGAILVTHHILQNMSGSQVGTMFTVAPAAGALGEAIYSVSIRFRDVERLQTSLNEATKRLAQDELEVNALQESFGRLGPDGMTYLKSLALSRALAISEARGKLAEMQDNLEAARLNKNRTNTIKYIGNIAAVLGAIGSVTSFTAAAKTMSVNSTAGIYWFSVGALSAGTSYTIFDFVGKYAGIANADYVALKKRVDSLSGNLAAEEASQRRLAELLSL